MKAVGITAEYNPLHNGHVYHMHQAKQLSGCDAVVVAMSGNFVQRGMPAVFDKWTRAEHALKCGADLVVEIPLLYCLGNAGQYASASVRLLESLGKVSHVSFGSETGDASSLEELARFIRNNRSRIGEEIASDRYSGLSYPAAREKSVLDMLNNCDSGNYTPDISPGQVSSILNNPNDILALEYITAMKKAAPVAVKRIGAGYRQSADDSLQFQSASAIRDMIAKGDIISSHVPECVSDSICGKGLSERGMDDRLLDLIRYAVMNRSAEWIDDCPSGGEGLGNLLRSAVNKAESLDELIHSVKSKRYTYTRISRLLMQVLLGITRSEYYPSFGMSTGKMNTSDRIDASYVRVLGFNERGRELLSEIKHEESAAVPVITNINKERSRLDEYARKLLSLDIYGTSIYDLLSGGKGVSSDLTKGPVIIKK